MPSSSLPFISGKDRNRVVRALQKGGRLIAIRARGKTAASLDGRQIPEEWIRALGRQRVITPVLVDKHGDGDSAALYALTDKWREAAI